MSPPSDVCAQSPLSHVPEPRKTLGTACEAGETPKIGKMRLCPSEEDPCPGAGGLGHVQRGSRQRVSPHPANFAKAAFEAVALATTQLPSPGVTEWLGVVKLSLQVHGVLKQSETDREAAMEQSCLGKEGPACLEM